jgi:hypothetical protein
METAGQQTVFLATSLDPAVAEQATVFDLYVLWQSYTPRKDQGFSH